MKVCFPSPKHIFPELVHYVAMSDVKYFIIDVIKPKLGHLFHGFVCPSVK